MIDCVGEPSPEPFLVKELIVLTQHVHLRVFVQQPGRDILVKDTNDKRWQKCENDVEARHCP